jgi:MerR family transcriptional regulator, thiopeptide resistance regulator
MSKKKNKQPEFKPFSEKKQKRYERIARLQYGPENVNESIRRWNSYSKAEQQAIQDEGGRNYLALTEALKAGTPVYDAEVQALIRRWYEHIRYFYEPTLEIARGLGQLYTTDAEFGAFFAKFHPALAEYLDQAITFYVDALEEAELARLLAEDATDVQTLR